MSVNPSSPGGGFAAAAPRCRRRYVVLTTSQNEIAVSIVGIGGYRYRWRSDIFKQKLIVGMLGTPGMLAGSVPTSDGEAA
jgi:hypothetical protein